MIKIKKSIKHLSSTVLCAVLLCGTYSNVANAGLITLEDDGNAVIQKEDGVATLVWLDLDQTTNMTASDAETFAIGYHFATKDEFDTIFDSFFASFNHDTGKDYSTTPSDVSLVNDWVALFGTTKTTNNNHQNTSSVGMITNGDSIYSLGDKYTLRSNDEERGTIYDTATVNLNGSSVADYSDNSRGWYMVKDFVADNENNGSGTIEVPEPSSVAFFGLALLGFGVRRARK